jgi:hypothetical protein
MTQRGMLELVCYDEQVGEYKDVNPGVVGFDAR